MSRLTYQDAGVNPTKAHEAISAFVNYQKRHKLDPNLLSGIGPFASCYRLTDTLKACSDPVLVTCCDGVGTKAKLAIEWNAITTIGQDLVAMNVNDCLCMGATPLLFLDYFGCGKLDHDTFQTVLTSIHKACEMSHCTLVGGETAEMPGIYQGKDFDLAGFAVGIVDRSQILSKEKVCLHDRLIAIRSSGFHSNGFSLIRKLVEQEKIHPGDVPSFSTETWRELLLTPTYLYVSEVRGVMSKLHALAHITGGGLYENLPRVLPDAYTAVINSSQWQIPKLFLWAQEKAELTTTELLSTFNCGVGMIMVCPESEVEPIISHLSTETLAREKLVAFEIGTVEKRIHANEPVVWKA